MTLAVGTTLKNGIYVIDAWVTEDSIGPVYLAMDVLKGQWIQLRVLGSRSPQALPDAPDRQAFYQHLKQVADLKHLGLPSRLDGFDEEGVCYQILSIPSGTPVEQLATASAPLPPRVSLVILRQLMTSLQALRPLGWQGLRLTPDQLWYNPETQAITFTGFDLVTHDPDESAEPDADHHRVAAVTPQESALVQNLSRLLYFLLTGQRAEATKAPLAIEVRRHHPSLPRSLDQALELGHPQNQQLPTVTLAEWAAMLPAADALPVDLRPGAAAAAVLKRDRTSNHWPETQAMLPPAATKRSSTPTVALMLTGLIATVGGLGAGLYARLQPANSASQERLSPNQSFPPLPDWDSNTLWQPWDEAPTRRSRPDYGDPPPGAVPAPDFTPDPQEPAAPPPAVPQPVPTPDPNLDGLPEPWDSPVEPWVAPEPGVPTQPEPLPEVEPAPAPTAPSAPPLLRNPNEGAAPPPLTAPPIPSAPAPASS